MNIVWPLVCRCLVLCDGSEENLSAMLGRFVEMCRRKGLKVNAGKSKVMVLGEEDGLDCEVCVDGIRLKHVWEGNRSRTMGVCVCLESILKVAFIIWRKN